MKTLKLFLLVFTCIIVASCNKKMEEQEKPKSVYNKKIQLFTLPVFENILDDPYSEFAKGYLELKKETPDVIQKGDNYEKIFLSDEGINIMYWFYDKKYQIQTVVINAPTKKFSLSMFIGLNKSEIEEIIQNKAFSVTEYSIEYLSDDCLFFVDFNFDKNKITNKIIIGRSL